MASARAKALPVGSPAWINAEREQSKQFLNQEAEEFSYSVKNELEWLNEHMAEVFSKDRVNYVDVFKTPGKLRGKTPQTARKQNALGHRQPLTDTFAPNVPNPQSAQKTALFDKVAHFQITEDAENQPPSHQRPKSRSKSPQRIGKQINTDSGYHGMTEDEIDIDSKTETATVSSQQSTAQQVPLRENQPPPQRLNEGTGDGRVSSDDSFESAREDLTSRRLSKGQLREDRTVDNVPVSEDKMELDREVQAPGPEPAAPEAQSEPIDEDQDLEGEVSRTQSDVSSPEKPLQRKSSFTFTALPPRDPLTAKKSIGTRTSPIDAQASRNSTLARSFGAKSFGVTQGEEAEYMENKSEESKAHNKTSTQLLHERITMLGKTKEPRASKSFHPSVLGTQAAYPQLPATEPDNNAEPADDSDDDWIAPTKPAQAKTVEAVQEQSEPKTNSPERPAMHQKSVSTTQIPSPSRPNTEGDSRHQKAISVPNPSVTGFASAVPSTTPAGSPVGKKHNDGPLSASKNKLYSVLKSAKSIFASSASASAAAKLEAHNNSPSRSPKRDISDESKTAAVFNMPGALYSERQLAPSPGRPISIISALSASASRKTRSSNESAKQREKELKEQQKTADALEKAREKERQKAAKQQEQKQKAEEAEAANKAKKAPKQQPTQPDRSISAGSGKSRESEMPPPPPPKTTQAAGKLRAPSRVAKPAQAQSSKPAPVSIRVGLGLSSQRLHQVPPSSSLSKSHPENPAPAVSQKQAGVRSGSAHSSVRSSTAANNQRLKALEAAARKKEADEKAAQKKADQKREMERKIAAKKEEEKRVEEERKAAEQQRMQDAKLAAQRQAEKQAAEAKKREQERIEQQRQQEEAQKAKAAHELAEAIKRERAQQQQAHPRGDIGGTLRQLAKNTVTEPATNRPPVQTNPAKPAKRVWVPDEEDQPAHYQPQQPQRPGLQRGPPSYQQNEAKRRRTNEDEQHEERHSVMAPPKRPSGMRKESTLSKFPHGYMGAPAPANHGPSMFKTTVYGNHQAQHGLKPGMHTHPSQLVQLATGKIPFAENANPPATAQNYAQGQIHPGFENVQPGIPQNKFKTPARPAQAPKSAKSSPLYPNGDNIQLPDIATDSEDEDSDDEDTGFRAPSWVASPALRELLTQQQLVDPETVFGPIAELKMEEVFRNGKNQDRLKKFRDRTSSAAWVQNGDAVTSAEKRRDMELRERVVKEGGWRYQPDL